MKSKYTTEDMLRIAMKKEGKLLSEKYIGYKIKLKWKCKEGHEFKMMPAQVLDGRWCQKCGKKRSRKNSPWGAKIATNSDVEAFQKIKR